MGLPTRLVAAIHDTSVAMIERHYSRWITEGLDQPAERLAFLPPFAPAAETCTRTMVESNIWIRWAEALIEASVSKKASNIPALLSRSNRFHTDFQWPSVPAMLASALSPR
jgi:hypothetical protein